AALPPEDRPETGPRKEVPQHLRRAMVDYRTREPAGTIIIDTANTYLYLVLGNGKAMRYGIGVGREGFTWAGAERVSRMAEWPGPAPPRRDDRTPALSAALHGRRRRQPARRARSLSRQNALSHPRHQPAVDHRHVRVVGVYPPHQRRHHRPLSAGAGRHARGRAAGTAAGLGERGTTVRSGAPGTVQSAGPPAHAIAPFAFDLSLPGLDPGNDYLRTAMTHACQSPRRSL